MIEEEAGGGGRGGRGGGGETFILWQPSVIAVAHSLSRISAGENDRTTCFSAQWPSERFSPLVHRKQLVV